jgi:hypothetical protein
VCANVCGSWQLSPNCAPAAAATLQNGAAAPEPVIAVQWRPMADPNEIEALKASMRGVRESAGQLAPLAERVEALDPLADVSDADLADLERMTLAHAVAAQALRGFVHTMLKRRGKAEEASAIQTGGEE